MLECEKCGSRMNHNNETTKLTEYACPECHWVKISPKNSYRVTA